VSELDADAIGARTPGRYGASPPQLVLAETIIEVAWNIQGDVAREAFADAVTNAFRVDLPATPNTSTRMNRIRALWLGPRSWLLVSGMGPPPLPFADFIAQRDTVNAAGGALFDVSASRIAFTLRGARAGPVLAKRCPLDFHARAFAPGRVAQSVFGHVNALFVRADDGAAFTVMVARSYARDVWHALCESAAVDGYEVAPPAPLE